jgi:DHA1 family bicyclomycin/chloramphenicol resistance-like MFS transporter
MQIQPASFAFTLLLGFLAAVPYSGIDINLPALAATATTLHVHPSDVGLTMSAFMLSLAAAPLIYGPVSDRVGRKPIVVFGITLFAFASLACAFAPSLRVLLFCRLAQGIGAAASVVTFAIIRDLFDEDTARAKIANVVIAINVATVIAPTAGAALLTLGWRQIYAVQAVIGLILLFAVLFGFAESARTDTALRLTPSAAFGSYLRVLKHPISSVYILVGAAAGATVFAYVTGSSLFFINIVGLRPQQYGLIFSACSAAVMSGAFLDSRMGRWGISSAQALMIGLMLLAFASAILLALTVVGRASPPLVAGLLMAVALAFGLSLPNVMNATMRPLPEIAGAVGAAAGSIQMTSGAISSAMVSVFFDGQSALSMTIVMAVSSLLALTTYLLVVRPAERRLRFEVTEPIRPVASPTHP